MATYKTKLADWKKMLEEELDRRVLWDEVERGTGIAYSTLQKHQSHTYTRPDFATAAKICEFFSKTSKRTLRKVTPLDYFEEVSDFKLGRAKSIA